MKIFIDNGHGIYTPGKRSLDGRFLEYKFNREIAARVVSDLMDRGFDVELLVPELNDISLAERCRRVNAYCKAHVRPSISATCRSITAKRKSS